jgi:hypothetical protein
LGTSLHHLIHHLSDKDISEKRVAKEIDGVLITGTADVLNGSELYDYKVTSAWHKVFNEGLPPHWVQQLNTYAYLSGGVKSAKIVVIYRDWQQSRAKDADYPPAQLMAYDVPLASPEDQLEYIRERIALHKEAEGLPDDALPICSPDDRWATETTYAVYKNANKTATRVLGSQAEADKLVESFERAGSKDTYRVEVREGVDKKCLVSCAVAKWCPHGKKVLEQNKGGE